jgi:superfamily I DNA/RNA helicase
MSHQIRMQADRLLAPKVSDVDGNTEERDDTVSLFNGPPPEILRFKTQREEIDAVSDWVSAKARDGLAPHEFGIFVRSPAELPPACEAVKKSGLPFKIIDENVETRAVTYPSARCILPRGLNSERSPACDDEVIPLQQRIKSVGDDADLQEVYDTERHLLYVACTRARDHLPVTCVEPGSEFLDDLTV